MPPDAFYTTLPSEEVLVDGVFKGGGSAGIVYIGALMALARNGIWFHRTAGTSAGAITAAIIAAGYDANGCDYLASPGDIRGGKPANFPSGVEPLNYLSLMDVPLSPGEVTLRSRRENMIYYSIAGPALDEILKSSAPLPSLEPYIKKIVDQIVRVIPREVGPFKVKVGPFKFKKNFPQPVGKVEIKTPEFETEVGPFPVGNVTAAVTQAVKTALTAYPRAMKLAETGLFATDQLRHAVADAVMSAIMITNPLIAVYLNWAGDGGLFKGDAFLRWMRNVLERAIGRSPVRFKDLKKPFACTACDVGRQSLVVYSSKGTPEMEVAEAVRRSMSIPMVFEPRREDGHEFVDGGTIENFPIGFFLPTETPYFESGVDAGGVSDRDRCKLAFVPGKGGLRPAADVSEMLKGLLPADRLSPISLVEITAINRALSVAVSNMQDSPLREAILNELENFGLHYYEIEGHDKQSAMNFFVEPDDFRRMCRHGWTATAERVQDAIAAGDIVLSHPLLTANPY
jgi:predicted acylesterase/phospholipase RssA